MYNWSKHKIGIVLSGGGAKGAYEIGCWKALLEESGIGFSAIAGTSIGGINGFLMSLVDIKAAEDIWIQMGRKTPLPISLRRLILFLLERFGHVVVRAIEIFVLLPIVGLLALFAIGLVVGLYYLTLHPILSPLQALLAPLIPLTLVASARLARSTRFGRFTSRGFRYSFRDSRRSARHQIPVEFATMLGLIFGLALPIAILLYQIIALGRAWPWILVLLACLALEVAGIVLSSDLGFSSPGEISLISTERLEELLLENIHEDETMPAPPNLYVARMREEVVSLPNSVPEWMNEVIKSIVPNKRWEDLTPQDLDAYRQKLNDLGLGDYFVNSTETVLGLEYVQLAGSSVLDAADVVLSTSAIADFLGRVQQRHIGIEEEDFVLSTMRAEFYDPGLVDNTPIGPLLENEECDLIVVVFLDHGIKDPTLYLEGQLNQINARVRRLNPDLDDETYENLKNMTFLNPVRAAPSRIRTVKLIPVIPSEDLGHGVIGFIRETLCFREKRIRYLMKLGYDDTSRAIDQFVQKSSSETRNVGGAQ